MPGNSPYDNAWDRFALAHPNLSHAAAFALAALVYALAARAFSVYDHFFPYTGTDP